MKRLVVMYGAIHVNVLLVSLFMMGWVNGIGLTVLQVGYVAPLLWYLKYYDIPKRKMPLKERGLWVIGGLGVMVSIALIRSTIFSGSETNQEMLVTVQNQVPMLPFILFLLNASVVEEVFYRELLWGVLSKPITQVVITSFLFALAHHPSSLFTWGIYGSLGLILGVVRWQTDCLTSTLVHLSWNGIVFILSMV